MLADAAKPIMTPADLRWLVAPELDDGTLAVEHRTPIRTRRVAETVARRCAKSAAPDVAAYCVVDTKYERVVLVVKAR